MPKPTIPLLILAGPAGSGKTSIVNRLLRRELRGTRTAVVLNEFGAEALDEATAGAQLRLEGGCACCTLAAESARALAELLAREAPERVLMEVPGTVHVRALMRMMRWPSLDGRFDPIRVCAVADALRWPALHRCSAVLDELLHHAHAAIITHGDCATADQISATRESIGEANPELPIWVTAGGRAAWDVLMGTVFPAGVGCERPGGETELLPVRIALYSHPQRAAFEHLMGRLPAGVRRLRGVVKLADAGLMQVEFDDARLRLEPCAEAVGADALDRLEGWAAPELAEALELGLEGRLGVEITLDAADSLQGRLAQ